MPEYPVLAAVAPVGGDDLAAIAAAAEHADHAVCPNTGRIETANDFGFGLAAVAADQPHQSALADAEFVAGRADQAKARRVAAPRPGDRPGQRKSLRIAAGPFDWQDLGQRRAAGEFPVPGARQLAVALDRPQQLAQGRLVGRSEPERAGDLT